jgi:hypothetical protein
MSVVVTVAYIAAVVEVVGVPVLPALFHLLKKKLKVELFKVPFRAPGSEEKISRSTHTIHTGIDSTCT